MTRTDTPATRIVFDNRMLLFALDRLYREAMQPFERALLPAVRQVGHALGVSPLDVPTEGYYGDDADLTEYFRWMRALQVVPEAAERRVTDLPAFQRLWQVSTSPIYGRPERNGWLLPTGLDPLTRALETSEWSLARLVPAARTAALEADDVSLVGLAARIGDAVALTALRESVVLYAQVFILGEQPAPSVDWQVDPALATAANRFVQAFNALVPGALPAVVPENAVLFIDPLKPFRIEGRCVRIGFDPLSVPSRHYHWAIRAPTGGELEVEEFWSDDLWTTDRYRKELSRRNRWLQVLGRRK